MFLLVLKKEMEVDIEIMNAERRVKVEQNDGKMEKQTKAERLIIMKIELLYRALQSMRLSQSGRRLLKLGGRTKISQDQALKWFLYWREFESVAG